MPASSKQQQKFMGMVHALKKGDMNPSDASPELKKAADSMSDTDAKDFASTPHKGLPKRVKQEIVRKLKEYAMTLPSHHAKSAAPMDSLRSDDEMDVQETRIPQNFNVGTTQDYHTKLATTPRKKYDKTNFDPEHSGQEDLKEGDDKLEMLKLFNKALKMMPGSPKQKEVIKQLNVIRTRNGLKPLNEKQVVNKLAEYASKMDLSYIQNKDAKLDGTPDEKDAIDKKIESVNEAGLKGVEGIPSNKKLSQLSDNDKLKVLQSTGNLISFKVPDWSKGRRNFWTVISAGKIIKKKNLSGEIIFFLPGKGPEKVSPTYPSVKELLNGVNWDTMELRRESVNEGCWKGYKQVGGKMKNGRMVPNCVPESVNEELSFDEKQMVIGIIEILKQVDDRKNRMRIVLNMIKKFKDEGIVFDYQKFVDALKEYSMGSYEYDKGNRELGEAMIWQAKDMIYKIVPQSTFARYAKNPPKNREFVDSIIRDLTQVLNRFYKQNDIDLILR
jgi:hypothetical protein